MSNILPTASLLKTQIFISKLLLPMVCIAGSIILNACGGGGSSSDGTVFQGTLTEQGTGHLTDKLLTVKHSAGQRISDVKICILNQCSITDDLGQWGVNVPKLNDEALTITVEGHGISTSLQVDIPTTARDVIIDLDHKGEKVTFSKLIIDGEDQAAELAIPVTL